MNEDTRKQLRSDLLGDEGLRTTAYQDTLGYTTIGIGRNIDPRGGGITEEEAFYLLDNDIARVSAQLDSALPWWKHLDDTRQRVLANMAFNLGISRLLNFHNFIGALRLGNYQQAADEMLDSKWAKSDVPKRAQRLAELMRS